jgi:ABC-type transport system involved in cytochrome bd biosynthesis fused ATPase/permease subunit
MGLFVIQGLTSPAFQTELLDEFTDKPAAVPSSLELQARDEGAIRIHDGVFAWISEDDKDGKDFSAIRNFRLRIPELKFVKGKLNLIAGPTGCGKSSLLQVSVKHDSGGRS